MIKKIKFEKFTAFDSLDIDFSPGINVFIGENGTGKTHILKTIY
ncbi:MAG TPA: AAA family ATPase, partial [bacterium]|nr:AAA family ATPase [bacterium]